MYTFSSKLKTFSIILMVVGLLGIGYGFLTAPKTIQDVEKILAEQEHHGGGHGEANAHEVIAHEATGKEAATHEAAGDKVEGHEAGHKTETPVDVVEPATAKSADSLQKDGDSIVAVTDTVHNVATADEMKSHIEPTEEAH